VFFFKAVQILDRLAHETGQTMVWVRGVMRRYGPGTTGVG
jgi:hypothetical protein